jgi:hypothetical protein
MVEDLRGKITLTRLEPCENIARYSVIAVRDDFKMTGQSARKYPKAAKSAAWLQKNCGKSGKPEPLADPN